MTGIDDTGKWTKPRLFIDNDGGETIAYIDDGWTVMVGGWYLELPALTATDGASIPRLLWRVCGHPLESPRVYAALVHDWLYSGCGPDMTRKDADGIYRELLVRFGFPTWRAAVEYHALRLFGGSHWTTRPKDGGR